MSLLELTQGGVSQQAPEQQKLGAPPCGCGGFLVPRTGSMPQAQEPRAGRQGWALAGARAIGALKRPSPQVYDSQER